jgi:hypothetical protein
MVWIIACGSVMCAWSMLSIIGSERQRRIIELKQKALHDAEAARPESQSAEEPIIVSSQ